LIWVKSISALWMHDGVRPAGPIGGARELDRVRRHDSETAKRLQAGKRRAPRDQLECFRTLTRLAVGEIGRTSIAFGNAHAPILPYACGEILRGTEDDFRKLQRMVANPPARGPR